jgi:hypothetical protein
VGRRQRHTEFMYASAQRLEWIAKDKTEPMEQRMKALAELKFRRRRNRQKRSK